MQLAENIVEATTEIFTTMVMMDIVPGFPLPNGQKCPGVEVSGMIGLTGALKGMLAIHLPGSVAKTITGNFLGIEVDEINEDVQDAIGEMANMLGGSIKGMLSKNGRGIELSLPFTVCGKEYRFTQGDSVEVIAVPFKTENGDFLVELQMEKKVR